MKNNVKSFIFIPIIFSLGGGLLGGAIGGAIGGTILGMTAGQLGGFLGMMGGSLLGNTLFPVENETPWPQVGNYPIQKSGQGPPVDKVFGTVKKAGHFIWEGDLDPYAIEQDSGGKGGDDTVTTGYGYRQSFLIDLGEGPGEVLKIWANEKLIYPASSYHGRHGEMLHDLDITIFEGDDNDGVKDLTGEAFGEWPHNIMVFFNEFDLGTSTTKPNFTFEVGHPLTQYLVGLNPYTGNAIVAMGKDDDTLDTDWGASGYIDVSPDSGPLRCMFITSKGQILISHNYNKVSMYNSDGTLDTTWGNSGKYDPHDNEDFYPDGFDTFDIKEDTDGNFYLIGWVGYSSGYVTLVKLDADGGYIGSLTANDTRVNPLYEAAWSDDAKTTLIICGGEYIVYGSYPNDYYPTIVAVAVATMTIDTSWAGNVPGHAGFFAITTHAGNPAYHTINQTSDGGYIVKQNSANQLLKILPDGSALDTDWAINGILTFINYASAGYDEATNPAQDGDTLYIIVSESRSGNVFDVLYKVDGDGVATEIKAWDVPSSKGYQSVAVFNNNLILGTNKSAPATKNVEIWTKAGVFVSGFDVVNTNVVWWILPVTSEATDVTFAYMCRELLTDSRYGAGFDGIINEASFTAMITYCLENGLIGSINLSEQKPWRDWLDYICAHFGGWYRESGGELYLGAYRDETAVFDLSCANADFVVDLDSFEPPIRVKERDETETFNRIKVAWTDRANDYAEAITVVQDECDQRRTGTVREKIFNLAGIMTEALAQKMAYRLLFESMYRFKVYTFMLSFKNMLIEVGDVGTISDGDKIVSQKVRILRIDEDETGRGLACTAIEDASGLYPEIDFSSQGSLLPETEEITLADGTINYIESDISNELHLSITPGNAYTNGWYIYKSYDNTTYSLLGRCTISGITGGSANSVGTIQGFIPAHEANTWIPEETVNVSIGTVTDLHTDISEVQFWNDLRLAKIGDEIIAFRDAVETSTAGIWTISCLRRGLFNTEAVAHYSGEAFCTLDKNYTYRYTDSDISKTIYFKAIAFYGESVQGISDVTGKAITIEGLSLRPAAASLIRLTADQNDGGSGEYSGASFTLYWNLGSRSSGYNFGDWLNLPWDNYIADSQLQKIVLKFYEDDGTTLIGQREIAVASSETITKATDLGGNDRAIIKVVPRRVYESILKNSILVESI